jgi:hypothetical protein
MRFERLVIFGWLLIGIHGGAFACNASYDRGIVQVHCARIEGDPKPLKAFMRDLGGGNVVVTGVLATALENPGITGLTIITTPSFHAAVVSGTHSACGGSTVLKPSVTQTGNNVDIQLKMLIGVTEPHACQNVLLAGLRFAEAVPFLSVGNVRALTYSVNGIPITPEF